jgi:hypothetical protein
VGGTGAVGPTGAAGPTGSFGTVTIVSNASANNSADKSVTASCGAGEVVVGGGYTITDGVDVTARESYPSSPSAWTATGEEIGNEGSNWVITAYALCGQ